MNDRDTKVIQNSIQAIDKLASDYIALSLMNKIKGEYDPYLERGYPHAKFNAYGVISKTISDISKDEPLFTLKDIISIPKSVLQTCEKAYYNNFIPELKSGGFNDENIISFENFYEEIRVACIEATNILKEEFEKEYANEIL